MGSKTFLIITNNPLVNDIKDAEVFFVAGEWRQVLYQAYGQVAVGRRLLAHPLTGSFKPGENPYRSIVLDCFKTSADLPALAILDRCMAMAEGSGKIIKTEAMEALAGDFQKFDRYLLDGILQSLNGSKV